MPPPLPTTASASAMSLSSPGASLCLHGRHLCHRERLAGFDFCLEHILQDKSAPFQPCSYQVKPHKRCQRPAAKPVNGQTGMGVAVTLDKRDNFCAEHSRKSLLSRHKLGRKRPAQESQRYLEDLAQYKEPRLEPAATATPTLAAATSLKAAPVGTGDNNSPPALPVNPHKVVAEPVAVKDEQTQPEEELYDVLRSTLPPNGTRNNADVVSEAESDDGGVHGDDAGGGASDVFGPNAWKADEGDSEAESVDSDLEDPLKHAGVYSAEEVVRLMRDRLLSLQKLYIDQFQRLQYLLRDERRKYRLHVNKEKEDAFMSVHAQPKDTPQELADFAKLKSLNHYNRPHGVESVLQAQLMEKRRRASEGPGSKVDGPGSKAQAGGPKCFYNLTVSTKCGETCVPMSKYCIKHVLEDNTQVLFRVCGFSTEADGPCETPIADVLEGSTCVYHTQMQPSVQDDKETDRKTPVDTKKEEPGLAAEAATAEGTKPAKL